MPQIVDKSYFNKQNILYIPLSSEAPIPIAVTSTPNDGTYIDNLCIEIEKTILVNALGLTTYNELQLALADIDNPLNASYKKSLKGNNIELAKQRNVAGEMRASMGAITYAVKMGLKNIRIHYDYSGVEYWATGKWKRNNEFTRGYHEFVQKVLNENPWLHIQFIKVKAHSGDPFNDLADELAKQVCGVV